MNAAAGDYELFVSGQHVRQGALAGTIRSHDGVYFTGLEGEIDAVEDGLVLYRNVQVLDGQHDGITPLRLPG